ncbi:MAG: hypothetical protein GX220_01375 [Treponema sp.]|nr:hypothetical protein [Treponema sp.]
MKKLICFFFAFCTTFFIFATDFSFNIKHPKVISMRDFSMGGLFVADNSSYYSFIANPANIGLTGNKILFPSAQVNVNGNLQQLPLFINSIIESNESDDSNLMTKMLEILSQAENIRIGTDISGPLSFGAIKENFGWGFFNRTYALAEIPSISSSNIYGGEEFLFKMGYAYPVKFSEFIISLGIGAQGFFQTEGIFNDAPTELLNIDFNSFPMHTILGYGFDLGINVQMFRIFRIAFNWENFFGQTFVKKYDTFSQIFTFKSDYDTKMQITTPKLALGCAVDIPMKTWTRGFISSWKIMFDINNLFNLVNETPLSRNKLLELSYGTELMIFNTLAFRFGINETYMALGFGLKLEYLCIDYAIYGKELGLEPGAVPELNMGFSITIQK